MDKYDEHIEAILKKPSRIKRDWADAKGLFQHLAPDNANLAGCPTLVKGGWRSFDHKLDNEVRSSALIPSLSRNILPDRAMLNEFARIQRLADKVYNRV